MPALLSPTLDLVFKILFSNAENEDLLISLLTAVLRPASRIRRVTVLNPDLPKDAVHMRGVVLDIRVVLDDGREVDIEMQSLVRASTRPRSLYHWARMFGYQLGRGDLFKALVPCVAVFLLAEPALRWPRFHSTFRVLEVHEHEPLCEHLEIHFVELTKLAAWNAIAGRDEPLLDDWCTFLLPDDDADRERVAMSNPIIHKAKTQLERLSSDEETRALARQREEWLQLDCMERFVAREEGREEGRKEGRDEGHKEGRDEGRKEGRDEGLAAARAAVMALLTSRGWTVSNEVRATVNGCEDLTVLLSWMTRAGTAEDLSDVFA